MNKNKASGMCYKAVYLYWLSDYGIFIPWSWMQIASAALWPSKSNYSSVILDTWVLKRKYRLYVIVIWDKKCQYLTVANLSPVKMSDEPYVSMNHMHTLVCYITNEGKIFST